jgi:hypothetical protein
MKQPKYLICLLLICCLCIGLRAQYIRELHDTWYDDALVDLQFNTIHKRPEGLFKLGTGYNVLGYSESTGAVLTSKFVVVQNKTVTPKCMSQAGAKCFVFSEDATHFFYTCLNTNTGVIDYNIAILRTNTNFYTNLSPVDAVYDGVSTMHIVLSAKNFQNPAVWNLVHLSIDVGLGTILSARIWGDPTWDVYPNDIEFVDAQHIYASGWRKSHVPIGYAYKHMVLPLVAPNASTVFDFVVTGTRPKSAHLKSIGGNLYLVADGYLPSLTAAGPLAVLGFTDNNNGTITLNTQRLYGSPGATFWIHDVQKQDLPGAGTIVASGSLPIFGTFTPSSPRNFIFDTGTNTGTMNDYGPYLGGNVNIRTAYPVSNYRLFSVAKDDNMALVMHDLRTNPYPTTTDCRVPLSLATLNNQINLYTNVVPDQAITGFTPQSFPRYESSKTYTLQPSCWESTPKAAEQEDLLTSATGELTISPNPTDGVVHLGNIENIREIRVYDPSGRLLLVRELGAGTASTEIDLTSVPTGLYVLETESGGERTRTKIVRK